MRFRPSACVLPSVCASWCGCVGAGVVCVSAGVVCVRAGVVCVRTGRLCVRADGLCLFCRRYVEKESFESSDSAPEKHNLSYFPTVNDLQNHIHQS